MKVLVALEQRFCRDANGRYYCEGPANYSFWTRYLEAFDEVVVLSRVGVDEGPWAEEARADGPRVLFWPLRDYQGPWHYLRSLPELRTRVRTAVANCDAFILRVPGLVGRLAWHEIQRLRKPYALEVLSDPWDALGPGTWPSLFRPVFRRAGVSELRRMCQNATAIHYVTERTLQRRYPPGKNTYAVGFSDASLDCAFASPATVETRLRRIKELAAGSSSGGKSLRIGFVGSLSSLYKGPDVLLRAASLCLRGDLDIEIEIAGYGRCATTMKTLARRLGVEDHVRFFGQLQFGRAVFDFLDSIDLFAMPSRAEGLPRALLEAMARGCPCIGADVGGIPELLAQEDLVPSGDAQALAGKIMQVARDLQRLKAMSERNLQKARKFKPETLRNACRDFYRFVRTHSADGGPV